VLVLTAQQERRVSLELAGLRVLLALVLPVPLGLLASVDPQVLRVPQVQAYLVQPAQQVQ
jgi:hypothetical protein